MTRLVVVAVLYWCTTKHYPGHAAALEVRARVLRDAEDYRASLADYEAFLATQKRPNPGHYIAAATLLTKLEDAGIHSALELLDRGIARLGLIPQLQQYAIELELERRNTSQAIARQQTLKPLLGESPEWRLEMVEMLLLAGRPDEARRHLEYAGDRLAELRMTPARQRALEKLHELQEAL